jgi:hypothetical protein
VKVKFSRHAKRRAKLYKIPEPAIQKALRPLELTQGEHEIIKDIPGFDLPIKIVITVKDELGTVITNYPLKKGRKK